MNAGATLVGVPAQSFARALYARELGRAYDAAEDASWACEGAAQFVRYAERDAPGAVVRARIELETRETDLFAALLSHAWKSAEVM